MKHFLLCCPQNGKTWATHTLFQIQLRQQDLIFTVLLKAGSGVLPLAVVLNSCGEGRDVLSRCHFSQHPGNPLLLQMWRQTKGTMINKPPVFLLSWKSFLGPVSFSGWAELLAQRLSRLLLKPNILWDTLSAGDWAQGQVAAKPL